jgi:hypothetical protein
MSLINTKSVFSFVIPYSLSLWFRLPELDIFRELQLMQAKKVGKSILSVTIGARVGGVHRGTSGRDRRIRAFKKPIQLVLVVGPTA